MSDNSTTETAPLLRGDSTLTYVPGMGTDSRGILVNVGGGNLNQLTDNNLLDVYDIGSKSWVRQATQGTAFHELVCESPRNDPHRLKHGQHVAPCLRFAR